MADDERDPQQADDQPDTEGDGFREYVAQVDPGTAAEMEALIERLEHEPEGSDLPLEESPGQPS